MNLTGNIHIVEGNMTSSVFFVDSLHDSIRCVICYCFFSLCFVFLCMVYSRL